MEPLLKHMYRDPSKERSLRLSPRVFHQNLEKSEIEFPPDTMRCDRSRAMENKRRQRGSIRGQGGGYEGQNGL